MSSSSEDTSKILKPLEQHYKVMMESQDTYIFELERLREQHQVENSFLKQENYDLLRKIDKLTEENKPLYKLLNGSEPTHNTSETPEWYLELVEGADSDDESGDGSASLTVVEGGSTDNWKCTACTFINNTSRTDCKICNTPRQRP